MDIKRFDDLFAKARMRLLQLHYDSQTGHLGGNLSCLQALMVVHHLTMKPEDRFILSKGHAAGALYITLWSLGKISDQELRTYGAEGTSFPVHPSGNGIPGLLFATGSLGHGPSLAAGLALSAKQRTQPHHVYCVCSDGEWQEGSCWEALIFAVPQKLDNLTIKIDQNGLQGFGSTQEVISCSNLTPRLIAFGANVQQGSGHNSASILNALSQKSTDRPNIIVLNTVKGKGTHFEGKIESHYLPINKEQYDFAQASHTHEQLK